MVETFVTPHMIISEWHVVHLEQDHERKAHMLSLPPIVPELQWFPAIQHEHGAMGCLQSHRAIIEAARLRGDPFVAILEDDATFDAAAVPLLHTLNAPSDWQMLYLGGQRMRDLGSVVCGDTTWQRALVLTTHAYVLHASQFEKVLADLDLIINGTAPFTAIDQYYAMCIQSQGHAYLLSEPVVTQRAGHSHIEDTTVNYNMVLQRQDPIAPAEIDEKGIDQELDWPYVTVVTPTRGRPAFLKHMALYCLLQQHYPLDKIEWLIIDEHDEDQPPPVLIRSEVLKIRHIVLTRQGRVAITIAQKRNLGAQFASHGIIVHRDDDDYYLPTSLALQVRVFDNIHVNCVGCSDMLTYDIDKEVSQHLTQETMFEASMAYRKTFWVAQPFEARLAKGEGLSLLHNRHAQCRTVPANMVMICVHHGTNITGSLRDLTSDKNLTLWDAMSYSVQHFLHTVRVTRLMQIE